MAMNFMQANRATEAPLTEAAFKQAQIAAALRQQKQNEMQMYGSAAAKLGSMVPEGAWGKLGGAIMGGAAPAAEAGAAGAGAAGAAEAVGAGAAGAGGVGSALGALGPMGWAALLAGGMLIKKQFGGD
jgi:hypothetical protein